MTNIGARSRSLARALECLLEGGTMTRAGLKEASGLSKATVARLVTELEDRGLIIPRQVGQVEGPGRRSTGFAVPASVGHVLGFSFGLRSSHVIVLDIVGRQVGSRLEATPEFSDGVAATTWAAMFLSDCVSSLGDCGETLRLSVALPGRVRDGVSTSALPEPVTGVTRGDFGSKLEAALVAPVMFATDADMALAGVTSLGFVEADSSAVLLTLSTALTVSTRTRFGLIQARTAVFGDFASLPLGQAVLDEQDRGSPLTLRALLSVRGITSFAATQGIDLAETSDLWLSEQASIERLRQIFTAALEQAILVAAITTDPEVCVITGRLAPLAARVLPSLRERLSRRVEHAPRIVVPGTDDNGLTTALGAAQTALALEQIGFLNRVREGE